MIKKTLCLKMHNCNIFCTIAIRDRIVITSISNGQHINKWESAITLINFEQKIIFQM